MSVPPPGAVVRTLIAWTASLIVAAAFWWWVVPASSLPVWMLAIIPGAAIGGATALAARRPSRALAVLLVLGAAASSLGAEYVRAKHRWRHRLEQDAGLIAKLSPPARQALPGFLARGFWTDLADRPIELAAGILLGSLGALQAAGLAFERRFPTAAMCSRQATDVPRPTSEPQ